MADLRLPAAHAGAELARLMLDVVAEGMALPPDGVLRIEQPDDPELATSPRLLILEPHVGVWVGVALPPGTRWILRPDSEPSKSRIVLPPGVRR